MAIANANEILFTSFEPKRKNQFIMYVDGIPAYMIKGVSGLGFEQGEIKLNHINTYRKIRGKVNWKDVTLTLFDPITPSGAQAVMEWQRLHYESVTGRAGYSDFYMKDISLNVLGPVGDIVSEWILKQAFIKDIDFGDWNYDTESEAQNITMQLGMSYCILNY